MNSRSILVIPIGICLTALIGGGFIWYEFSGPGYYSELNIVRDELESIPQTKITVLDGVHDLTLEHIWVGVHIEGKGKMEFFDLDRDSFRSTEHLRLRSIGPYMIRIGGTGYVGVVESATGKPVRSEFWGGDVDIGPKSEFASMFPFQITNVQTAVAHYDDIYRVVAAWPPESSKQYFRDADGTDFYYYAEMNGVQPDR